MADNVAFYFLTRKCVCFWLIEENSRLPFTYLNDCIAPVPVLCVWESEPTTHVDLQANQWDIFPPENQSFSSLIEYMFICTIYGLNKKFIFKEMYGISISKPKLLRYTVPTLIYKQIYTMATLIQIL